MSDEMGKGRDEEKQVVKREKRGADEEEEGENGEKKQEGR